MDFKTRPMQPASPVPSVGSADLNNLGTDGEALARVKQLEVTLKTKNIDIESLEARLREFERERFELYEELDELKNSSEVGGKIEALEDHIQGLDNELAQANSRALDIEIKYNRAVQEYEKRLAKAEQGSPEEPADLQEKASLKEEQLSSALRSLSGQIGAYESQTKRLEYEMKTLQQMMRIKDIESDGLKDELQIVKKEAENSNAEYEKSSRALRILSGKIAHLEKECGGLEFQMDSFDMERRELYRENVNFMDTISEQAQEIDGLRRLIKKIENSPSQSSATQVEFEVVKECPNGSQPDATRSMVRESAVQNITANQDLKESVGNIPLPEESCSPQDTTKLFSTTMKFMGIGVVATAALAIASKICL